MLTLVLALQCIWTESFDTQNYFPPNDWIIINQDVLDAVWYPADWIGHTGSHCATIYGDTTYAGYDQGNLDYLITPQVLPQGNDTLLRFWHRATSAQGCTLDILVSTNTPPQLPQFNLEQSLYITETSWTQRLIPLGAYIGTPIYVAFKIKRVPVTDSVYLDDISLPDMTTQPPVCNGHLRSKGPPSQRHMQLWGTHYDMGYAHGYLLGEELATHMVKWGIPDSITAWYWENIILPDFRLKFSVPEKYQDEAQGMIDGIVSKGVDLYHPYLQREFTVEDILCSQKCDGESHSREELVEGEDCSNISGWGQSTIYDDTLQGGYIIARNFEGSLGQCTYNGNMSLIIVFASSSPDEYKLVLVSGDGLIGAPSGVNSEGVGFVRDCGNHDDTTTIPLNSLIPLQLSNRHGIEVVDPDSNSIADIFDFVHVQDHTTYRLSKDIHLFSPFDAYHPTPGGILEINNIGDSLRLASDNGLAPGPINSDYNLAATNHERVFYPPVYCSRYVRLADSINADIHLTTQRIINIANSVAQYGMNIQSVVIRPNLIVEHPSWPSIGVGYARRNRDATNQTKIWYSWNELFEDMVGIEEYRPAQKRADDQVFYMATIQRGSHISFVLAKPCEMTLQLYDVTGRQCWVALQNEYPAGVHTIDLPHLSNGVYFVQYHTNQEIQTKKILLIQ